MKWIVTAAIKRQEAGSWALEACISLLLALVFGLGCLQQLHLLRSCGRLEQAAGHALRELALYERLSGELIKAPVVRTVDPGLSALLIQQGGGLVFARQRLGHWLGLEPAEELQVPGLRNLRLSYLRGGQGPGRLSLQFELRSVWGQQLLRRSYPVLQYRGKRHSDEEQSRAPSVQEISLSPWAMEPLDRGRHYAQIYRSEGETGTQFVRSVDLCLDYYQEPQHIREELEREIRHYYEQGGSPGASILFIVPENSPEAGLSYLDGELRRRCEEEGLELCLELRDCSPHGSGEGQRGGEAGQKTE